MISEGVASFASRKALMRQFKGKQRLCSGCDNYFDTKKELCDHLRGGNCGAGIAERLRKSILSLKDRVEKNDGVWTESMRKTFAHIRFRQVQLVLLYPKSAKK